MSKDVATLLDRKQTFIWTDSWGMQLNVSRCQHLHLVPGIVVDLNMLNNLVGLSILRRVELISDMGVFIDSSIKSSAHVSKARQRVAMMKKISTLMSTWGYNSGI